MSGMSTSQARVVDPVLSTHARGYTNAEFVGTLILPFAEVPARGARVLKFGKTAFRTYMDLRRAPGGESRRVQFGYEAEPIAVYQDALEALVPDEVRDEAARTEPGVDLARGSIDMVANIVGLKREVEIANLVRAPGTYAAGNKVALAGTDKWSDPDSNPKEDVKAAKETVRRMIGRKPNVMVMGPGVFNALDDHPKLLEKLKYTSSDSITTAILARYFDVAEVIVGEAVYLPEGSTDDQPASDVWGGDVVLSYRPQGSNWMVPAFGYTYRLRGYPLVEKPYYENNRKSWVYPTVDEWRPYVTGAEGGFLIQGAV